MNRRALLRSFLGLAAAATLPLGAVYATTKRITRLFVEPEALITLVEGVEYFRRVEWVVDAGGRRRLFTDGLMYDTQEEALAGSEPRSPAAVEWVGRAR